VPGAAAAWHRVVLCLRAHGLPGLADPRVDAGGRPIFPPGVVVPPRAEAACRGLFDRLVPNALSPAPTPAQLAALLRFARCMRGHGIHDWPDPRPDGTFVTDARIRAALKSTFVVQLGACERLNPDPHGCVYFSAG
jgi:hypothetical protein